MDANRSKTTPESTLESTPQTTPAPTPQPPVPDAIRAPDGKFLPGWQGGPGRPKGSPNLTTRALHETFLAALDGAGGVDYLKDFAEKHPEAFVKVLGRMLPRQISVDATRAGLSDDVMDEIRKRAAGAGIQIADCGLDDDDEGEGEDGDEGLGGNGSRQRGAGSGN